MLKSKLASLTKTFEKILIELTEENIFSLSDNDHGIFNVLVGLHNEAFSIIVWDDEKPNFDYYLIYTTRKNETLEGYMVKLQPLLKDRNELTNLFAIFIAKKYNKNEEVAMDIFNLYQQHQRTIFERKDFFTFGDNLNKTIKETNGSLLIKGNKLPIYVPLYIPPLKKQEEKKSASNSIAKKADKHNYVYIMHNKLNGYYKIGRSIKPEHREKTLQAEEPDVMLIEKWIASAEVERRLHHKYKVKRKRGEWFELEESDIKEIKIYMLEVTSRNTKKSK